MLAVIIFSNTYWTFWDIMLLFFVWIPLVLLWCYSTVDIFRRRDLPGWGKALWILAVVFFPWVGILAYLIVRPWEEDLYSAPYRDVGGMTASPPAVSSQAAGGQSPAS